MAQPSRSRCLVICHSSPPLSLKQALEMIRDDVCVQVTPNHVRLGKVELSAQNAAGGRVTRGFAAASRLASARSL